VSTAGIPSPRVNTNVNVSSSPSTIPQTTLYAPCTDTSTSTGTRTGTVSTSTGTLTASPASGVIAAASSTDTVIPQNVVWDDRNSTTTSGSLTIVVSQIVTTINGVRTTVSVIPYLRWHLSNSPPQTETPIQTLLNTSDSPLTDSQRTGVIAGSVGGGLVALLALLALIFFIRRRRQSRDRNRVMEEKARRPPRHLLEAEADDYQDESFVPPTSQWDGMSLNNGSGSVVSAPRLLRARGSKTGSLFHENVWPPPNEVMQDPLLTSEDLGSSISLVTGIPMDTSRGSQTSLTPLSRPTSGHVPTAISTGEVVGAVGRQKRSSTYESMDTVDFYNYNRSHSRAESIEPLLDSSSPAGRTISPPPISLRTTAGSPPLSFRPGRTNMRVSYTAPNISHGTVGSGYSASSMSPGNDSVMAGSAGSENSEMLREVLNASSRTESPQEVSPLYHNIRRDIP
jgi:hypothetical protein